MTDFQIILSIQMKNQFILLKYIFFVFFCLLYCKSVNLHLQTTFKMFLNVSHISIRYSYQASIVTQRKFGPTTFINIIIMSPLRTKGDILFQSDFFFRFFCFFSAKLVRTITFLSFQIGQLYLVCGCMTIRRCVAYRNDRCGTLTFDLKVK